MRHRTVAVGAAAALAAGSAWLGVGAASATGAGSSGDDRWGNGWPTTATAPSVAAARQLAADKVGAAAAARSDVLILRGRTVRDAEVDINNDGFGPGDFFMFEEKLFDQDGTERVGRDSVRCEARIRTFSCEGTLRIAHKGKIMISGALFRENDLTLAVVGGTGAYKSASGQFNVFDLPRGEVLFVIHLLR